MNDQDNQEFQLSESERDVIQSLRERGFAVVVFNPIELQGADPGLLEEVLVAHGNVSLAEAQDTEPLVGGENG